MCLQFYIIYIYMYIFILRKKNFKKYWLSKAIAHFSSNLDKLYTILRKKWHLLLWITYKLLFIYFYNYIICKIKKLKYLYNLLFNIIIPIYIFVSIVIYFFSLFISTFLIYSCNNLFQSCIIYRIILKQAWDINV